MTVRYRSDHEFDWEQLSLSLGSCRSQLEAVLDDLPNRNDDGTVWDKGEIIHNVADYLEAIKDEVDDHAPRARTAVSILPGLHRVLREHCQEHLGELQDLGIDDVDSVVRLVVDEAMDNFWLGGFELRPLVERRHRLVAAWESEKEGLADLVPAVWLKSLHGLSEKAREKLRTDIADIFKQSMASNPGISMEQLREQVAKVIREKYNTTAGQRGVDRKRYPVERTFAAIAKHSGPTAGQSGRTAKARRPNTAGKRTATGGRRQRQAAR